jgi:hypothetical protein
MMRISKLAVIAVLTGTLGLVGCGDDSSTATGGTGGSAGSGGEGGMGGSVPLDACDSGPLTTTIDTMVAEGELACVNNIPFGLIIKLAATPTAPLQNGANEFDLQVEIAIDAETVNTVVDLAQEVTVTSSVSTIDATAGDSNPTPFDLDDGGVPCALTLVRDQASVMVTTIDANSWTLDEGGTLTLTLEAITQMVEALGLPVDLTTEGDEPSCMFVGDMPAVSFSLTM